MAFAIILSEQAVEDLGSLDAHVRAEVKNRIRLHLRDEPTKVSRSRIKRLRGLLKPQYRLRVGETRVFYDVTKSEVHILTIISKDHAAQWLREAGVSE